jgi:hypothetical protein
MDIDHNLISGCPLCEVFSNLSSYEILFESEDYIVINCKECNTPMMIIRDHIREITSDIYGKCLYKCKKLFSERITVDTKLLHSIEHFHMHIKVN